MFRLGERVRSRSGVDGEVAGPFNSYDNPGLKALGEGSVAVVWIFTDDGEVRRFREDALESLER